MECIIVNTMGINYKYLGIRIEWFGSEILFGLYLGNRNESYI